MLVLVNDPGFATQNNDLFKGNSMTYYGRWAYKYNEAARQGAKGVLVIHSTKPFLSTIRPLKTSDVRMDCYVYRMFKKIE